MNKKDIVLAAATTIATAFILFQLYDHRPFDTHGVDVYMVGNSYRDVGVLYRLGAHLWINGKPAALELPGNANSVATDIVEYNGDIYVAGRYGDQACYWKNGEIHIVGYGMANRIVVTDDAIHLAGFLAEESSYWKISSEGVKEVKLDDFGYADGLVNDGSYPIGSVDALVVYGDKAYVGVSYKALRYSSWGEYRIAQVWSIGEETVVFDVVDAMQDRSHYEFGTYAQDTPIIPESEGKESDINDIKIIDDKLHIVGTYKNSYGYWIYDGFALLEYKELTTRGDYSSVAIVQTTDNGVIIKKQWYDEDLDSFEECSFFDWDGNETVLPRSGNIFMWHDDNTYIAGNERLFSLWRGRSRGYLWVNDRKIKLPTDQLIVAAIIVPKRLLENRED